MSQLTDTQHDPFVHVSVHLSTLRKNTSDNAPTPMFSRTIIWTSEYLFPRSEQIIPSLNWELWDDAEDRSTYVLAPCPLFFFK